MIHELSPGALLQGPFLSRQRAQPVSLTVEAAALLPYRSAGALAWEPPDLALHPEGSSISDSAGL